MKTDKAIFCALLTALISASAFAQSATVTSVNAVGYVKVELEKKQLYQLTLPFEGMGANDMVPTNIFKDLPNGTIVYIWDPAQQRYNNELSVSKSFAGWNPASGATNSLAGKSFWLRVGDSTVTNKWSVYFMGEVPTASEKVVGLATNSFGALNFVGYAYPCEVLLTNMNFYKTAVNGDSILQYDPSQGRYNSASKSFAGWSFANAWTNPSQRVLQPGQAFWIRSRQQSTWSETKPYDWP